MTCQKKVDIKSLYIWHPNLVTPPTSEKEIHCILPFIYCIGLSNHHVIVFHVFISFYRSDCLRYWYFNEKYIIVQRLMLCILISLGIFFTHASLWVLWRCLELDVCCMLITLYHANCENVACVRYFHDNRCTLMYEVQRVL